MNSGLFLKQPCYLLIRLEKLSLLVPALVVLYPRLATPFYIVITFEPRLELQNPFGFMVDSMRVTIRQSFRLIALPFRRDMT